MATTTAEKLTRNQKRKAKYAALGAEGSDKAIRNAAIDSGLAEGAANLTAHDEIDGFERVTVGYDEDGPIRVKRPRVVEYKVLVSPSMPSAPKSGGRAAKRAALKARRMKSLPDRTLHKRGLHRCGNFGCDRCQGRARARGR